MYRKISTLLARSYWRNSTSLIFNKKRWHLHFFSFQLELVLNFLKLVNAIPSVAGFVLGQIVVKYLINDLNAWLYRHEELINIY